MKKLTKLFSLLLIAAMGVAMVACNEPDEPEQPEQPENPGQTEQPNEPEQPATNEPTVSVIAGEVGEEWISFDIVSANVQRVFYVAIAEDMIDVIEDFNVDWVLEWGQYLEEGANGTGHVIFEGRLPGTKYYVYAAGIKGDKKVLSECVEMTTLSETFENITLPEADFCNVILTAYSSYDLYAFTLTDEDNDLYFAFNIYTTAGCNGAIPAGTYTINATPNVGVVDLGSLILEINGLPHVISSGSINVELTNGGSTVSLDGDFKLVSGDNATFSYEGSFMMMGLDSGIQDESSLTFTQVPLLVPFEDVRGSYEVQFTLSQGFAMLDLQIYSDPSKGYITGGLYPVFESAADAAAAGMANSWINTYSMWQDNMMMPNAVLPGMDSYIQVVTALDNGGADYYEITFSLQVKSYVDGSISTLKGTYKGALGFTPSDDDAAMRMESMYVDITSSGNTHRFNFHGGFTTMIIDVEAESLPVEGDGFVTLNVVNAYFSDAYAEIYNSPVSNVVFQVKRFEDAEDASDNNKVKPYYAFKIEGEVNGMALTGDWRSFYKAYESGY